MNCRISLSPFFAREAKKLKKRYKSLDKDLAVLHKELQENPKLGVDLGHGIRKIRLAIGSKGKGKSHGARIISCIIAMDLENAEVLLLTIYDKAERDNITPQEIASLLQKLKEA